MSLSTVVASVEATAGAELHKLASVAKNIETALVGAVGDVDKIAPTVEKITSLIPGAGNALQAEQALVALADAAVAGYEAAESAVTNGFSVTFSAEIAALLKPLVDAYNTAKAAVKAV